MSPNQSQIIINKNILIVSLVGSENALLGDFVNECQLADYQERPNQVQINRCLR